MPKPKTIAIVFYRTDTGKKTTNIHDTTETSMQVEVSCSVLLSARSLLL